ncbi:fibronectin type III domain-containing protein [Butyrivibrio sp. FC2001]|uniref:fibronectin type III domain-containing protein n=1 Tax=Butyrivibrio sp. FC2001 TaxID=1280671 RepID=UPI0004173305|nr:fibronectin type III domain-containing protein [Butyrivibrio sp. FC2001]
MKTNCAKNTILKMVPFFILVMLLLFSVGTKSYAASSNKLKRPKITGVTKKKDSLEVKWTKVADAKGYKIYIADEESEEKCIATVKDPSITTYKIKGLKSGTKYSLKVKAYKKVNKKRVYSAFSPVKKVKTKLGLSKGYFSCKRFNISWDTSQWKVEDAYANSNSINLITKDKRLGDAASFSISPWYDEIVKDIQGKGLDEYAAWFINEDNQSTNGQKYERVAENKVIDGRTFAVLHATSPKLWYIKNNATLICPIEGKLFVITYYVPDSATSPEAKLQQIEELLSKIKIK